MTTVNIRPANTSFAHHEVRLCILHDRRPTVEQRVERREFYSMFDGYDIRYDVNFDRAHKEHFNVLEHFENPDESTYVHDTMFMDLLPGATDAERLQRCQEYGVQHHNQQIPIYTLTYYLPYDGEQHQHEYSDPTSLEQAMDRAYNLLHRQESFVAVEYGFEKLWQAYLQNDLFTLFQHFTHEELHDLGAEYCPNALSVIEDEMSTFMSTLHEYIQSMQAQHYGIQLTRFLRESRNYARQKLYYRLYLILFEQEYSIENTPTAWLLATYCDDDDYRAALREALKQREKDFQAYVTSVVNEQDTIQ